MAAQLDWCIRSSVSCDTGGMKTRLHLLRAVTQLAGDGFFGVLDAVEAMHRAIGNSLPVPGARLIDRATGFAYARVRDVGRAGTALARGSFALLERHGA